MKICKHCKLSFDNTAISQGKYVYTKDKAIFCSRKCNNRYRAGTRILTREILEEEVKVFVKKMGRYCTRHEIFRGINRSSKSFTAHKISLLDLQKRLGYSKVKSLFEFKIGEILCSMFEEVELEKTFEGMVSPKGFPLRIDFYIKSHNLAIEADGSQHYDKNNPWYNKYHVICDDAKSLFLKNKGITLVRIPYTNNISKAYLKNYI